MAKKPIPGMQETALSSLADQFPGSGGRGGSNPAAGTTTGPDSPSSDGTPPTSASTTYVRKGVSGWVLALAVLICLSAATVSLSAPSLRPVVRDLAAKFLPMVPQSYVDFLVGQSRDVVEINLSALDGRIAGLREAIAAVTDGAATDSDEMREFLTGALTFGTARRLEQHLTRLASDLKASREQSDANIANAADARGVLDAQLSTLESATDETRNLLGTRLDEAKEVDEALDGRLATTESQVTSSASLLSGIEERLRVAEDAAAPVASRIDDVEARTTAQAAAIATQTAAVEDLNATVNTLTQARIERIRPLLLILHLNNAISANRSYKASLDAASEALATISAASSDATAASVIAKLRRYEEDNIPSRDEITRSFDTISQSVLVAQQPSRIESLRVSIVSLLGAALDKPAPAISEHDQMKSKLRSIGTALRGGRLDEALEAASSLDSPEYRVQFNAWRAQARARLEVDAAVAALEVMAFKYLYAGR
jgi:DNA repair exonuclease SbcCD ATPase subunit